MKNAVITVLKFSLVALFLIALAGCDNPANSPPPVKHTVFFHANGSTVSPPDITVENGKTIASLPTPVKTGGDFDSVFWGWHTKDGTNGDWGSLFTTTSPVTADIIVYAQWGSTPPPTPCTITFNPDGGTVNPTSKQVLSGDPAGNLPTPTKSNNIFGGWYTGQSGGGSAFTAATIVTAHITVYAKWTASGGNTGNNGETNIGSSAHLGETITISSMPVYERVYDWQTETETLTLMNNAEPIELERRRNIFLYESKTTEYGFNLTITAGKINVTFPAPESGQLADITNKMRWFTVNPLGVKGLAVSAFFYRYDEHSYYDDRFDFDFRNKNNPNLHAVFVYVDRDVRMTGVYDDSGLFWDTSLKQGWNTVIIDYQTKTVELGAPGDDYVWVYRSEVRLFEDESDFGYNSFDVNADIISGTITDALIDGKVPDGGIKITYTENFGEVEGDVNSVFANTDGTWQLDISDRSDKSGRNGKFLVTLYLDADRKTYFNIAALFDSWSLEDPQYDPIGNKYILSNINLEVHTISTRQMTITLANTAGSVTILPYLSRNRGAEIGMVTSGNGTSTMKIYSYAADYLWLRVVSGSNTYITRGRVNITAPVMLDINQMYKLE